MNERVPVIEIDRLRVKFGNFLAVDDVTFAVNAGEVFGFLGPNGSGKTTTLRTLVDLLRPDSGRVRLFGVDVREGAGPLRARLGYLPSDWAGFPELSGRRALEFFTRLSGRPPILRDEVLDRLGFNRSAMDRRLRTYSTGMRQMIGITAAFQHDPELLLLDEPTTGLDPIVRDAFLGLVRAARNRGRTVFFSSHILDEVEEVADRVGLIAKGKLRLVEGMATLRERLPRSVRLRWRDGREEKRRTACGAEELLRGIDPEGLVDVEIRPVDLSEVFRDVVEGGVV